MLCLFFMAPSLIRKGFLFAHSFTPAFPAIPAPNQCESVSAGSMFCAFETLQGWETLLTLTLSLAESSPPTSLPLYSQERAPTSVAYAENQSMVGEGAGGSKA